MNPPRASFDPAVAAFAVAAAALATLAATPARAAETPASTPAAADIEQVRQSTVQLIGMLVEQGVLTRERADALLQEATLPARPADAPPAAAAPAAAPVAPGTVRVPYVPDFVRKQIKDEIRADLVAQAEREGWAGPGAVPEWVRRVEWYGDMRARLQYDNFISDNAPAVDVTATNRARSIVLLNTTEDRTRLRVRARAGVAATVDEHWSTDLRLTTGSATDPVSSNQTLGVYETRYTVALDRANLRYRDGKLLDAVVGRFGNPWFGTDLVWANDLSFDGVAAKWMPSLGADTRGFVTLAALPIQEVELSASDKWLLGAQVGLDAGKLMGEARGKLGVAYYDYRNIVGKTSPTGSAINEFTAPAFAQKGNSYYNISSDPNRPLLALASDYRLLDITGLLDVPVIHGKHAVLTGDFVRNLGYDRAAVSARVGADVQAKTTGWLMRLGFGSPEVARTGDWQLFSSYKHVERDAVLDAFTDSDFRLGGTDAKGYTIGGSLGLGRDTAATFRLMSGDSISGAPLSIDVMQLDLTTKF